MVDYADLYSTIVSKWNEIYSWPNEKKSDGDSLDINLFINSSKMTISLERDNLEMQI